MSVANEQPTGEVSQDLYDEIDGAVDNTMREIEAARDEAKPDDKKPLPSGTARSDDDSKGGQSPEADKGKEVETDDGKGGEDTPIEDAVTDTLTERAVKAGLPLAEVKKYTSASMLEFVCTKLETLGKPAGNGGDGDDGKKPDPSEDDPELTEMLGQIPELDPDVYDEKIVQLVGAMKGIIRKQHDAMKASGKPGAQSWFDSKVTGLGDAYAKELEKAPEVRTALKEQFDVLQAGYKAAGKQVDQETVFDQASAIVLKDVSARVADADKGGKLARRAGQHISRPHNASVSPTGDVFTETAAEIDRKYFDKK